jgi:hypothetical protein
MKKFLLFAFIGLSSACITASPMPSDSLLRVLRSEIARKKIYDRQKDEQIATLRQKLNTSQSIGLEARYLQLWTV